MRASYLFTSEIGLRRTPGQGVRPDLGRDPRCVPRERHQARHRRRQSINTRLGCETLTTTNKIVIAGEGRGQAPLFKKYGGHTIINRELLTEIARGVVKDIGYDQDGFSWHGADVEVLLHGQSPDIAMGVNAKKKKGNGKKAPATRA